MKRLLLFAFLFFIGNFTPFTGNFFVIQADDSAGPTYYLGAIPDRKVWQGATLWFTVKWMNHPDASFTMNVSPVPDGVIDLAYDGSDYAFYYRPDPLDKNAFSVTIEALDGVDALSQTFEIRTSPELPPESDVFGTDQHTQPSYMMGISVVTKENPVPEDFNYLTQNTANITIAGLLVEIEQGHENMLFETYFNGIPKQIKRMVIIGEEVIFRSPARLKGTEVTIYARSLRFEGSGSLKTTPEEKTGSPGSNSDGSGKPGAHGLDAGDVTLYISSFYADNSRVIDLTGGQGQKGGPGKDGPRGSDCEYRIYNPHTYCDSGKCATFNNDNYWGCTYQRFDYFGIIWDQWGDPNCRPTSGTDAEPSGLPGKGGNSGLITSSVNMAGYHTNIGGSAGDPAKSGSYYYGGRSGYPQNSYRIRFFGTGLWPFYYVVNYHLYPASMPNTPYMTSWGDNANVKRCEECEGDPVRADYPTGSQYAWLHHVLLRKILNRAKDTYLSGQIEAAAAQIVDYATLLEAYMDDAAWQDLEVDAPDAQHDLEQIYNDMQNMLHRLRNGLDYFGKPAGWVPMLSFEFTSLMFDKEIDRAINMLYLTYWIGNKAVSEQQRISALSTIRAHLWDEFEQARVNYDTAVENLPLLMGEAQRLETQTLNLQNELRVLETDLFNQAQGTKGPKAWEIGLRLGLKVDAMICKALPFWQPFIGELGGGILETASNMNFEKPWESIFEVPDIVDSTANAKYNSAVTQLGYKMKNVDSTWPEKQKVDTWKNIRRATGAVSGGVKDIRGYIESLGEPKPEVYAELERLKDQSPLYQDQVNKIKAHLDEKMKFAQNMAETMQKIASLADLMDENVLAVDALSRQIEDGIVLDDRATAYLEGIERRTYDRLLKYHYYMAKAYEYRLLESYAQPLDLEDLMLKFQDIAAINTGHEIKPDQFEAFKGIYQDILAGVAESIYNKYILEPPDLSIPLRFNLIKQDLEKLNKGETIKFNLRNLGFFFPEEENVRIVDLKIFDIETEAMDDDYGTFAHVDVLIEHSGISHIKSDGVIHQFRHYSPETKNAIRWGGRYDPFSEIIDDYMPSEASNSLLRSLLSDSASSDMLLYSRPSAWADLNIWRTYNNSSGKQINIKSLRLELVYDFTTRNDQLGLWDIEIMPCLNTPSGHDVELMPYFLLGEFDWNQRMDGRGRFLRIFQDEFDPIAVTAQENVGRWVFEKWTDGYGVDLPGGPFTDPTFDFIPMEDQVLCAQYKMLPIFGDMDEDFDIDASDLFGIIDAITSLDPKADLNEDGIFDASDLEIFSGNFGFIY